MELRACRNITSWPERSMNATTANRKTFSGTQRERSGIYQQRGAHDGQFRFLNEPPRHRSQALAEKRGQADDQLNAGLRIIVDELLKVGAGDRPVLGPDRSRSPSTLRSRGQRDPLLQPIHLSGSRRAALPDRRRGEPREATPLMIKKSFPWDCPCAISRSP